LISISVGPEINSNGKVESIGVAIEFETLMVGEFSAGEKVSPISEAVCGMNGFVSYVSIIRRMVVQHYIYIYIYIYNIEGDVYHPIDSNRLASYREAVNGLVK
jgi:hypothetical protein